MKMHNATAFDILNLPTKEEDRQEAINALLKKANLESQLRRKTREIFARLETPPFEPVLQYEAFQNQNEQDTVL